VSCCTWDLIYISLPRGVEFSAQDAKGAVLVFDELNEEAFSRRRNIAVMEMLDLSSIRINRFDFEPRIRTQ